MDGNLTASLTWMRKMVHGVLIAVLTVATFGCQRGPTAEDIQNAVREIVEADTSQHVERFYELRGFEPAFLHPDESDDLLHDAVDLLCRAQEQGLHPPDYLTPTLADKAGLAFDGDAASDSVAAHRIADLDVTLARILMTYASDVITGRVAPDPVSWKTPVHQIDPARVVGAAVADGNIESIPARVSNMHREYASLLEALEHYRRIEEQGGWPRIPAGDPLEEGASGRRVEALVRRLAAEGYADSTLLADTVFTYTQDVAESVRAMQGHYGLQPDGVAGERVIEVLNVSVEQRVRQIELNLERWRWIPGHLGSRYLYVNIPAFELHAFDEGEEVLSMAVVVGEVYEDNATPVFSDTMEYVVFNPYWNVPESIATEEIVPAARRNRSYIVRNDYEILSGWSGNARVLDPMTADLGRVESGAYRIRQKPGPQNSLGRIKFMFPNEFNIYLHDTPADYLFERTERAYSHGCIRVEKPVELAEYVLPEGEWDADRIRTQFGGRNQQTVSLETPLPIYILYWTAFVDSRGRMNFREDLYGNDASLSEDLEAHTAANGVPCDSVFALIDR